MQDSSIVKFTSEKIVLNYFSSEENRSRLFSAESSLSQVLKLSGGYSNYVYRLTFDDESTVILKYFARHVATAEYVPLSQERYFIEKNALEMAKQCSDDAELIKAPRIVAFDDRLSFLILEDCGSQLISLTDLLKNNSNYSSDANDLITRIVHDAKRFLTRMNSLAQSNLFENKSYWTTLNNNFPHIIQSVIDTYGLKEEIKPFLNNHRPFCQPESSVAYFVHGDFWSNSFLIDIDKQIVWLIDWESSRFDTAYRDLQSISSFLWLMKENEKLFSVDRINHLQRRLQHEFLGDESFDWRLKTDENVKDNFLLILSYALLTRDNLEANLENPKQTGLKALNEFLKF